jgi:hypothetical protein
MMRQSSLFPMRTDGHFFLAEPLSQCLLMADFVVEVGDWESSVFVASF